jgi:folate-binding protein YgfZ
MHHTLLFDRSDRARIEVGGAAAQATLNGLVTNDVAALRPGHGMYAAALTAKGKIVADVRVLQLDDRYLLDTSPRAAAGLREMLTKYVNPRFASVRDVTDATCQLTLVGSGAAALVVAVGDAAADTVAALATYAHQSATIAGADVLVVRDAPLGADARPAFDVVAPMSARDAIVSALRAAGAASGDAATWETLRVESGTPAWGIDMDDTTLVQEANLDELHAVSYTKGCYIGQETVARVHFRGHVNRMLRRLRFEDGIVPPVGTALVSTERGPVGEVRSAVRSERAGAVGIGMVRREVEDGERLVARWGGDETGVLVAGKATGAIV